MSVARVLRRKQPKVYARVLSCGWTIEPTTSGRGHITLVHESGRKTTVAATPGDSRSEANALAWMKRIERGNA